MARSKYNIKFYAGIAADIFFSRHPIIFFLFSVINSARVFSSAHRKTNLVRTEPIVCGWTSPQYTRASHLKQSNRERAHHFTEHFVCKIPSRSIALFSLSSFSFSLSPKPRRALYLSLFLVSFSLSLFLLSLSFLSLSLSLVSLSLFLVSLSLSFFRLSLSLSCLSLFLACIGSS